MESQKDKILKLLQEADRNEVSCYEFANLFLYHKLATRCGELRREGHCILFEKGDSVMTGKYKLYENRIPLKEIIYDDNQGLLF